MASRTQATRDSAVAAAGSTASLEEVARQRITEADVEQRDEGGMGVRKRPGAARLRSMGVTVAQHRTDAERRAGNGMLRRLMRRLLPGRREGTGNRRAGPIRAEALRSVAAYLGDWAATEDAPLERNDAILTGPPPTGTKLASHIASILINAVDHAAADADLAGIPLDIRGSTQDPAASRAVARSLAVAAHDLRASRQAQVLAADLHDGITSATPLLEDIEALAGRGCAVRGYARGTGRPQCCYTTEHAEASLSGALGRPLLP